MVCVMTSPELPSAYPFFETETVHGLVYQGAFGMIEVRG
jgi:hypothetical protein